MTRLCVQTWATRFAITVAAVLIVLAVVSGWYSVGYAMQSGSRMTMLGMGNGQGVFGISDQGTQANTGWSLQRFDPHWRWWFSIAQTPRSSQMLFPIWAPALVLVVLGWWLRPKRLANGQCTTCGYSLDGLPSDVCPECGVNDEG